MKITKNELKSLINECINEIVNEQSHKCNCDSGLNSETCKCKPSENTQKTSETKELINKFKIQRGLKKFPYADDDVVKKYINSHPNSATLKQLEDDAKENKWNEDTTKAIYYIMSIINKKKDNDI